MTHHVYSLPLPDATYVGVTVMEVAKKQKLLRDSPPKWLGLEFPGVMYKVVPITERRVNKASALALEAAHVALLMAQGEYVRGGS